MHRYAPSPVSMQVALPAQGLDEHRRVSVGREEEREKTKKQKRKAVFRSCVRSLTPPPLPLSPPPPPPPPSRSPSLFFFFPFTTHAFVSAPSPVFTLQHLVTENKTESEATPTRRRAAHMFPVEQGTYCRRSQGGQTEPEAEKNFSCSFICFWVCLGEGVFTP